MNEALPIAFAMFLPRLGFSAIINLFIIVPRKILIYCFLSVVNIKYPVINMEIANVIILLIYCGLTVLSCKQITISIINMNMFIIRPNFSTEEYVFFAKQIKIK